MTDVVRTNPFVEVVPALDRDEPELVLSDYDRNERFPVPNVGVLRVLELAAAGMERTTLVEQTAAEFDTDEKTIRAAVDRLVEEELLVPETEFPATLLDRRDEWAAAGWAAAFDYFVGIRDFPFYEDQGRQAPLERAQQRYEEHGEPPSVYETYPDAPTVSLPAVDESADLGSLRALLGPVADAPARPLDADALSELLYYAFGETGRQTLPGVGDFLLKTSPSGGSRHPTEAYVVVDGVDGVEAGVYHYSVRDHALERLGGPARADGAERADGLPVPDAPLRVVLAGRVERNMWKYRDPRAFRVPHHDAGHVMETLRVVCHATGFDVRFVPGYHAAAVEDVLGVDSLEEPLLGYALIS